VWGNSLAADKPQYNPDFTEMTAKSRSGIFWSDGVEFTADDVISTVMTQIKNPGFALAKQSKLTRAWFKGFPYGHPGPTLPAVIFNTQNELFKNPDVRWALALLMDMKAVAMAAYRGAATISAIGVPPKGMHPAAYHQPMKEWLKGFEIDTALPGPGCADMVRPRLRRI
jgi:ABC-type transport system substrate-binding protein